MVHPNMTLDFDVSIQLNSRHAKILIGIFLYDYFTDHATLLSLLTDVFQKMCQKINENRMIVNLLNQEIMSRVALSRCRST